MSHKNQQVPLPPAGQGPFIWRAAYLGLYTLGACFTICLVSLLAWVAYCIAVEAEPLASLSFLPALPQGAIFAILFLSLIICCGCWQLGAMCHQKYTARQE